MKQGLTKVVVYDAEGRAVVELAAIEYDVAVHIAQAVNLAAVIDSAIEVYRERGTPFNRGKTVP